MDKPAAWVGVDVSKGELVVAVRPSGEQFSLANDGRAVRSLIKRLAPLNCARIVVEATGGYETLPVAALQAALIPYKSAYKESASSRARNSSPAIARAAENKIGLYRRTNSSQASSMPTRHAAAIARSARRSESMAASGASPEAESDT